jgi:hypothetical protein
MSLCNAVLYGCCVLFKVSIVCIDLLFVIGAKLWYVNSLFYRRCSVERNDI